MALELEQIKLPKVVKRRSKIAWESQGFLNAAIEVISKNSDYWPLSVRQIHYRLLSKDFLRNRNTGQRYVNTDSCYKALSRLLSRARINGDIDWDCIDDETRPFSCGEGYANPKEFYEAEKTTSWKAMAEI